jgi:hypothetical protein
MAALAAVTAGLARGMADSAAAIVTQNFAAVADAHVNSSKATTNYGTSSKLILAASPATRVYARFAVAGLAGPVSRATLRLYVLNGSPVGLAVRGVADNGWGESTITYANAPAPSAATTSSSGPVSSRQWVSLDVTPLVTGDGPLTVALTTTTNAQFTVASREYGASFAAQLVVETVDNRPANTSAPTIAGTAAENETLTADRGTWTGAEPMTYGYQWRRCDAAGASCVNIAGATAYRFVLTAADVGSTLRVAVTAANSAGSSTAVTAQTAVVKAAAPPPAPPPPPPPPPGGVKKKPTPPTPNKRGLRGGG